MNQDIKKMQKAADKYFATVYSLIDSTEGLSPTILKIKDKDDRDMVLAEYHKVIAHLKDMTKAADHFFDMIGADKK